MLLDTFLRRAPALVTTLLLVACGSGSLRSSSEHDRSGAPFRMPARVTEENFGRLRGQLDAMSSQATDRPALRDLLVQYLARECTEDLRADRADDAAEDFGDALQAYLASDLPDALDPRLVDCAQGIRRALGPGGDEARVMAALTVLNHLHPSDQSVLAERRLLASWSVEARRSLPNGAEQVGSLIEVYEDLVDLLPLPEFVNKLRDLYLRRHESLRELFTSNRMPPPGSLTREQYQMYVAALDRTSYDMIRLYLRVGQPLRALEALSGVRPAGEVDRRMQATLQSLQDNPADGYMELAQAFGREDPRSALRSCRMGREAAPESPRYPLCIGRLLALTGELGAAISAYDDAIQASPGEPELYREALVVSQESLRQLLDDEDLGGAHQAFHHARQLIREYQHAFPDRAVPLDVAQIEYLMGMGEYESGNIDEALEHLTASASIKATKDALVQIGIIAERRGSSDDALRSYRRALDLDLPRDQARLDGWWRATILEHLADATAAKNDRARADSLYAEALEAWRRTLTAHGSGLSAEELATGQLRRGMVLEKTGHRADAVEAFRAAIDARPELRQTYAHLLSYYAADGRLRELLQTYRSAINHSSIPDYWKIYYAMWVVATQRRAGDDSEPSAMQYLREVHGDDWQNKLARFYAGTMPYDALLSSASNAGERAEANFYEALNQLAAGHVPQATELFRQVLSSEMMGFFEYDMARQILAQLGTHSPAGATRTP